MSLLVLGQVDHLRCWWCGSKVGIIVCDWIIVIVIILLVFNKLNCTVLSLDALLRVAPSMKVDGEWPRLAADPVWWTIEDSQLSEVWSPFGSG